LQAIVFFLERVRGVEEKIEATTPTLGGKNPQKAEGIPAVIGNRETHVFATARGIDRRGLKGGF